MKTFSENLGKSKDSKGIYDNQRQAVDAAYAAGIIDGEGYIGIIKTKPQRADRTPRYDLRVEVNMTDASVPIHLYRLYGGKLQQRARKQENWKDTWVWVLTCKKDIAIFLADIYPYLHTKKSHAELALAFIDECPFTRRGHKQVPASEILEREEFRLRMKKLNFRGAAATTERESNREVEATVWTCGKLQEES